VRLFTQTRSNVELTQAGAELLDGGRRLLADLEGTVARVRMAGRGQAGLVRVGVAHLAESAVASALAAFQAEYASIVVDRSAMVSERLLDQLAEGRLHAAVVHQVPTLATVDQVTSEPLRRGRLAVLAGPHGKRPALAGQPQPAGAGPFGKLPQELLISWRSLHAGLALVLCHVRHLVSPLSLELHH